MIPKIKVMGPTSPEEQAVIVTAVLALTQAQAKPMSESSQLSNWQKTARTRGLRHPLETQSTSQRSPWQS